MTIFHLYGTLLLSLLSNRKGVAILPSFWASGGYNKKVVLTMISVTDMEFLGSIITGAGNCKSAIST
jgi:hypothetical protein